tara:strand:+ start:765 stop:980 length:216 start_codon:yes stop_codon:yes gene_type:complete
MTYFNAELEQTTLEVEIDAREIVQDAECEIEEMIDGVIDSRGCISREDIEDMIDEAVAKIFKRLGVSTDDE